MATKQEWADAIEEVRAVSHANRPYWRVMLDPDEPRFVVVCLQPWDESDYNQPRFLTDRIYDEAEAERRADYANSLMPPYLRTLGAIRLIRQASGAL